MDDARQVEDGRALRAGAEAPHRAGVADVSLDHLDVRIAAPDGLRRGAGKDEAAHAVEARLLAHHGVVRVWLVQEVHEPVPEPAREAGDERCGV